MKDKTIDIQPTSSCCEAPVRASHGCYSDLGHRGSVCMCQRDTATWWCECEKCGKRCDTKNKESYKGNYTIC